MFGELHVTRVAEDHACLRGALVVAVLRADHRIALVDDVGGESSFVLFALLRTETVYALLLRLCRQRASVGCAAGDGLRRLTFRPSAKRQRMTWWRFIFS